MIHILDSLTIMMQAIPIFFVIGWMALGLCEIDLLDNGEYELSYDEDDVDTMKILGVDYAQGEDVTVEEIYDLEMYYDRLRWAIETPPEDIEGLMKKK